MSFRQKWNTGSPNWEIAWNQSLIRFINGESNTRCLMCRSQLFPAKKNCRIKKRNLNHRLLKPTDPRTHVKISFIDFFCGGLDLPQQPFRAFKQCSGIEFCATESVTEMVTNLNHFPQVVRSEERRVGKESRSRWSP